MTGVDFEQQNGSLYIRALGERLDGSNQILETMEENGLFRNSYSKVELDMARVEFINSLGITELVDMQRRFTDNMQRKTTLHFTNVDPKVNAILELVEFHRVAKISLKGENARD